MIGNSLNSDIKLAKNAGIDRLLVLTGNTKLKMILNLNKN